MVACAATVVTAQPRTVVKLKRAELMLEQGKSICAQGYLTHESSKLEREVVQAIGDDCCSARLQPCFLSLACKL